MVCFVHDRQFLSKFHAAINQMRQTNEFCVLTLRQLPKRCCSCPKKTNDVTSTAVQPLLTSIDIDALRLICLQTDLKQYVATDALSQPSKILHYAVLPFPTLVNPKQQEKISNQFIVEQENPLHLLQEMHHSHLEFMTSATSEQLLKEVVQIKSDLVAKCSNYSEAVHAIYGLWVIISADNQSHIDLVKHSLQKQWKRFIMNSYIDYPTTACNWWENLLPKAATKKSKAATKKCLYLQRVKIKHQKMLEMQAAKRQVVAAMRMVMRQRWQPVFSHEHEHNDDDDDEETGDYLVEDLVMTNPQLTFLHNRFQNCNRTRPPRTHRRQHLMALAMVA
jgi:hypothetical protein